MSIWKRSRARGLRIRRDTGEYYLHLKVRGKPVTPSATGTTSESEAILIRDNRVKLAQSGSVASEQLLDQTQPAAQPSVTVGELANTYERNLNLLELKPNARLFRQELLAVFRKTWPDLDMPATMVGGQVIRDWAAKLTTYSARRFNGFLDTVRYILDLGVEMQALRSNPMQKSTAKPPAVKKRKIPKSKYGRDNLLSEEQFSQIVEWIRNNGRGLSAYGANLVLFLRYTGLRISEATRLERQHVELLPAPENGIYGWLRVPAIKSLEPRDVPILEPTFKVLQSWLKVCRRKSRTFRAGDRYERVIGEWLSPSDDAYRAIRKACGALGIKVPVSHHTFRHLFGTWCFENGMEDLAVAGLLGHADKGKLARDTYTHSRPSFVRQETLKLSSALSMRSSPAVAP